MSPVEALCLERILGGLLRLSSQGEVEYYHPKRKRWYVKRPHQHPESGRWRFSFKMGNSGCTVYRNRLVWMLVYRQGIPESYFVDHVDGDFLNDSPDNLALMQRKASHQQGNEVATNRILGKLSRWFEFVGRSGGEPKLPHELSFVEDGF